MKKVMVVSIEDYKNHMNKARYVYLNALNQDIRNHGSKSTVWTRNNMNNVLNRCIFDKTISIPTIKIMIV